MDFHVLSHDKIQVSCSIVFLRARIAHDRALILRIIVFSRSGSDFYVSSYDKIKLLCIIVFLRARIAHDRARFVAYYRIIIIGLGLFTYYRITK